MNHYSNKPLFYRGRIGIRFLSILSVAVSFMIFTSHDVFAGSIVVNSTDDNTTSDANCTLREAITNANANANTHAECGAGDVGGDTITFLVAGTIVVAAGGLPAITDGNLVIDGSTAPGAACGVTGSLTVSLDGTSAGAESGLNVLDASMVTIRGLHIHSFSENGIQVDNSTDVTIQCNYIGTDVNATAADPNGKNGILITSGSSDVLVGTDGDGTNDAAEFNVISGNGAAAGSGGVLVNGSDNSIVAGNLIGTDRSGLTDVGNSGIGVQIYNGSSGNRVGTNSDGVSDEIERNIIAGNGTHGVSIFDVGTTNNVVAGNYIGLNTDGLGAIPNDAAGVNITNGAANNLIGGPGAADPNVISGNGTSGVWVQTAYTTFVGGTRTSNNTIQRNVIGLDPYDDPQGNGNQGVLIDLTVNTVVISNTIEENTLRGIYVRGAETSISENRIRNNGRSGIEVTYDEGTDSHNPESEATTTDDIVSSVSIFDNLIEGNCKSSNPCAGIYGNDDSVDPDSRDKGVTVAAANTINLNNGRPDVAQYWYGAVELLDGSVPQSGTPTVTSANSGPSYNLTVAETAAASLDGTILHGPVNFSTDNVQTWAFFVEFEVDEAGASTDYAPHVVDFVPYSFDADAATNPSDTEDGFIGEGIDSVRHAAYSTVNPTSFTLTRYQIMQSSVPYVTLATTPSVTEGAPAQVTATLNTVLNRDVVVTVAFANQTTASDDYTPSTTTITIQAGSMSASIPVATTSDMTDEPDETYQVSIANVTNATDASTPQTTTILDDDAPTVPGLPTVTLAGTQTVNEGTTATVSLSLDAASADLVTVTLAYSNGTADSATDYTAGILVVVIPAGSTTGITTVDTTNDVIDEQDETFQVRIASVVNANDGSTPQTITILDDDDTPDPQPTLPVTVTLSATPLVIEGNTVMVTATLSAVSADDVTVIVSYTDQVATSGSDFTPTATTIVIPAGSTSATIPVTTVADADSEGNEDFQVAITAVTNANDGSTPQTVIISDPAPIPDDENRTPTNLNDVAEPDLDEQTLFLPLLVQ